jgi:O-antigen/teichoic acid export membrane protein
MVRATMVSCVGFGVVFVSSVVVSRLLGVEGKGVFSLFMTTVSGLWIVATVGIPQGQMYHASRDSRWLSHFMANAYLLSVVTGGTVALVYFWGGRELGLKHVTALDLSALVAGVVAVPAGVLLIYQRQYLLVLGRFELAKAAGAVSLTLPLVGYVFLYLLGYVEVNAFVWAFTASQLLCFPVFLIPARRAGPTQRQFSPELARRSLSFGVQQFASDVTLYVVTRVDFFLVLLYLGREGLGIYSVAAALAEIITRLSNEVGTMLYPVFAGRTLRQGAPVAALRTVTLMAVFTATILWVISGPLVRVLFGAPFADAVPAFRWLLVGSVAWSTTHVTWAYVSGALGRPAVGVLVFGLAASVDVLLNVVLLPHLGVTGASVAATMSYLLAAFLFLRLFAKSESCSLREALIANSSDVRRLWRAGRQAAGFTGGTLPVGS